MSIFCKNANNIVLCPQINDKKILEDNLIWKNQIYQNIDITNMPMIIIQNKSDLLGNESEYNKNIEEFKEIGKKMERLIV